MDLQQELAEIKARTDIDDTERKKLIRKARRQARKTEVKKSTALEWFPGYIKRVIRHLEASGLERKRWDLDSTAYVWILNQARDKQFPSDGFIQRFNEIKTGSEGPKCYYLFQGHNHQIMLGLF